MNSKKKQIKKTIRIPEKTTRQTLALRSGNKRIGSPQPNTQPSQRPKNESTNNGNGNREADVENDKGIEAEERINMEMDFIKWLEKNNISIAEVLSKNVKMGKGPKAKDKTTEILGVLKEIRVAGRYLLGEKERLERELENIKNEKIEAEAQSAQAIKKLEEEFEDIKKRLQEKEEELGKLRKYAEELQSYNAKLQQELTNSKKEYSNSEAERLQQKEELVKANGEAKFLKKEIKQLNQKSDCSIEALNERVSFLQRSNQEETVRSREIREQLEKAIESRDRFEAEAKKWQKQAELYLEKTGMHASELEQIECKKTVLEQHFEEEMLKNEKLNKDLAMALQRVEFANKLVEQKEKIISELQVENSNLKLSIDVKNSEISCGQIERRKLHNMIQELKGNIRVFCRVRPKLENEEDSDPYTNSKIIEYSKNEISSSDKVISILSPLAPMQPYQKFTFEFDKVFDHSASQALIFEEISELVQSALDGYKVCVFAYGQTGSGKTYTMLGDKENRGVIPRAMSQVFKSSKDMESLGWSFAMHASMLEIYNEEYQDLLGSNLPSGKKHTVSHDAEGNTNISDMTWMSVKDSSTVESLLQAAIAKRAVSSTLINEHSSRSHMVFTLRIEGVNSSTLQKVQGVLNLIDLAGSERVKESGATGSRMKEAQYINKSLSSLGDVIFSISNKSEHVPYRNSKLTWLLKPCLGGDSKALMFVNISGNSQHASESLCSLRFAAKVNACEIGIARRTVHQSIK